MSSTRTLPVNIFTWKKEKPCFPGAGKILSSQHRSVVLTLCWYSRIPTSLTLQPWWFKYSKGREFDSRPGEHGFPFFQLKTFTGSVRVLLTSVSLKLKSNYQELGYTSCWQMIKETCWQIIYFLMFKFFPCRQISN